MFASLESFSLFFFVSLALIVLLIVYEDKIIALVEKHETKLKKGSGNNEHKRNGL